MPNSSLKAEITPTLRYFKEVYTVEDVTTLPVVTEKNFD